MFYLSEFYTFIYKGGYSKESMLFEWRGQVLFISFLFTE